MSKDVFKPPKYIKRLHKVRKGTPAYENGYRWFDAKEMKHYKKLPKSLIGKLTKYSPARHGM